LPVTCWLRKPRDHINGAEVIARAQEAMQGAWVAILELGVSRGSLARTLQNAERFISGVKHSIDIASLAEHDMVRMTCDVESDGYHLSRGMVGTVVSVYREGEAFAVEFPDLEDAPAVVTVRPDEIEVVGANATLPGSHSRSRVRE